MPCHENGSPARGEFILLSSLKHRGTSIALAQSDQFDNLDLIARVTALNGERAVVHLAVLGAVAALAREDLLLARPDM